LAAIPRAPTFAPGKEPVACTGHVQMLFISVYYSLLETIFYGSHFKRNTGQLFRHRWHRHCINQLRRDISDQDKTVKTEHRLPAIEQFIIAPKRQPIDYHSLTKTAFFWLHSWHIIAEN
jgi:hypothetical protein